jgi:hypothetical protein
VPGEVDGVGAQSATDFEDSLSAPPFEIGETRNVRLDEILTGFYFVKILLAPDALPGVPEIAGPLIPEIPNLVNGAVL